MQVIVFKLEDCFYGINTEVVEEISELTKATIIPNAPEWIKGLINLRGDVITLIDLGKLLEFNEDIEYTNVIIVKIEEEQLGLMVNEIVEVAKIKKSDIQKVDKNMESGILGVIKIENEIISIIDINNLISKKEG